MPPNHQRPSKTSPRKASPAGKKPLRPRGWRIFFSVFKWCRVSVLLAILGLIVLGLFVNRVGLPEWIKQRIVAQMRAQGWEMEFSRLRLLWYRGVVADHVTFSRTNGTAGPQLFLERAEFRLNARALRHFDLHADSVQLHDGRLIWPLPGTNEPKRSLALNGLRGELLFKPDDHWELRSLEATLLGTQVRIRGDLTNASLIRDWKLPERPPGTTTGDKAIQWHQLLGQIDQVRFTGLPRLSGIFTLDARDFRSLEASVRFMAPGAESPWAGGTNFVLLARLRPPATTNTPFQAELTLKADDAHSRWGAATNITLTLKGDPTFTQPVPTNLSAALQLHDARTPWGKAGKLLLSAQSGPGAAGDQRRLTRLQAAAETVRSEWGSAAKFDLTAQLTHPATNLLPAAVAGDFEVFSPRTRRGTSDWARVTAQFDLPAAEQFRVFNTNTSWFERLQNIPITVTTALTNLQAAGLSAASLRLTNRWRWPQFDFETAGQVWGGEVTAQGSLNTDKRELRIATSSQFDPHTLASPLGTNYPAWLNDCTWTTAPRLDLSARAILPAWTNRAPDWSREVWPTVSAAGRLGLGRSAYRGIACESAHVWFRYTNSAWLIPELSLIRSEGALEADGSWDDRTGAFRARVRSGLDPMAIKPLFRPDKVPEVFNFFQFTQPPQWQAEVAGNSRAWSNLTGAAELAVTNVTFRGQFVQSCTTRVLYTNQFLSILRPLVWHEGRHGTAEGLGVDLARQRMYFTNATGNLPPMVVVNAIGEHVARLVRPYVFELPPDSHVEGHFPFGKDDGSARMSFEVTGGPFHWENFHFEHTHAVVLWLGRDLIITNMQSRWHGGSAQGDAHFDFSQPRGGMFQFHARVDGSDLKAVVMDFNAGQTNQLEGKFGGDVRVTEAYLEDLKSWQGHGSANLRDGLLWDTPAFGLFSPVLNAFIPGLGNSRAKEGVATFHVTNSIIHTKDLEIRATAMRMNYSGTIDFALQLDTKLEAELLRDMPGVGLILSKVFWPVTKIFEYRVTGPLGQPKAEPLWGLPRLILFPFQPIKTLRDLFGDEDKPGKP